MRTIKVSAIQMSMAKDRMANIQKAKDMVISAAKQGADVVLLPELFETQYFCQEKNYDYYNLATTIEDNLAIKVMSEVAREYNIVIPLSIYELNGYVTYNTVVMIDADGSNLGIYRKTHIPDDHFYQEKFYFTPGDTGFKVFDTKKGKIGVGICWDQWFPEVARSLALLGAEVILYPTAIGQEPILECDSMPHWRNCMKGHAACNIVPVVASNRVGTETVIPSKDNNNQASSLTFYGSSFIADETGEIVEMADRDSEIIISHEFDLDAIKDKRFSWGLYRDRRPDMYGGLVC